MSRTYSTDILRARGISPAQYYASSGDLTTDIATIGATPTTLAVFEPTVMSGSVTVPSTCRIRFLDGGVITIAAGQTLTLNGDLEAPRTKIFNAEHATTSVVAIGKQGPRTLMPEWWGAIGDDVTNDQPAIQLMLNVTSSSTNALQLSFGPGKGYRCNTTLMFAPSWNTNKVWQYKVNGNKARLKFRGATLGANPAVLLGDWLAESIDQRQLIFTAFVDLHIQGDAACLSTPGCVGCEVGFINFVGFDRCSFDSFYDCIISTGGFGNSVWFKDCNISGFGRCGYTVGARVGDPVAVCNNWRWEGGKIQQGPLGAFTGSVAHALIRNVDFSLCTEGSVHMELSGGVIEDVYSEAHDYQPGNTHKLIHLDRCSGVAVIRTNVNGTSPLGNAGYGIYLENSDAINLDQVAFSRHSIADIYIDEDCGAEIDIKSTCISDSNFQNRSSQPNIIDLRGGRGKPTPNWRDLPHRPLDWGPGGQKNGIQSPNDFSHPSWAFSGGASVTDTVVAPDGKSTAQVVSFPTSGSATALGTIGAINPGGAALNGRTVRFSYWVKPIASLGVGAGGDYNRLLSALRRGSNTDVLETEGAFNGLDGWQFVQQRVKFPDETPDGNTLAQIYFHAATNYNPISVAIWGLQLTVEGNDYPAPYSPTWSAFDAPRVEQPGFLAELPATASLADVIARVNAYGQRQRLIGLESEFKFEEMDGIRVVVDPSRSADTTTEGAAVSFLANVLPFTEAFAATGAARPTYVASGINGLPCINFAAANSQAMTSSSFFNVAVTSDEYVFFAVVRPSSIATDSETPTSNVGVFNATTQWGVHLQSTGPQAQVNHYDGSTYQKVESTTPAVTNAFLVTVTYDGDTLAIAINDGAAVTLSVASGIANPAKAMTIGKSQGGAFFNGDVGFMAIGKTLSAGAVATAKAALMAKFGL